MKYLEAIDAIDGRPRLIPNFKKTERRLLSVFLSLLSMSSVIRGHFLRQCGYNSGLTCAFDSVMEVTYKGSQMPEVRPDGLMVCTKGKTSWAAFIEAKSEKNTIRTDQITNYLELAKLTGVKTVITISNEYARVPEEPPYHVDPKKSRNVTVLHFAWAGIRTDLELLRGNTALTDVENALVEQCLTFFWDDASGVQTFDAMPESWPAFVEAASTALGFNANVKGLTEVVYGWQQERRELCSKLTHQLDSVVELRHKAGVRSSDDDRTKTDRQDLANDYTLSAHYLMKDAKLNLKVHMDLRACRMSAALDVPLPEGKGGRACVNWIAKVLTDNDTNGASICIDWPGRGPDYMGTVEAFLAEPEIIYEGQKAAPKGIKLIQSRHGVRAFKSRKKVIHDLEEMVLGLTACGQRLGWM